MGSVNRITPKVPESSWMASFFDEGLLAANAYQIDTPKVNVKLDQNESPWDWPVELKREVLARVEARAWNRYPETIGDELTTALADYVGVPSSCVLTGPGSNHLITLLLDALARGVKGKVVIARPSFPLFEMHCRYAGLQVEPWLLDEEFQYQTNALPDLPPGSILVFASPNNPTGSSLSRSDLEKILSANPDSYVIADEAYYEFDGEPATDLLARFHNLIIMRTLSKTMGAAGVRLGYILGAEPLIAELKKLRLPYLLNHFAMEAALYILSSDRMKSFVRKNVDNVVSERNRVYLSLKDMAKGSGVWVKPSTANFFLMKCSDQVQCELIYKGLIERDVLVRNISAGPGLAGCLRVSIGLPEENDQFLAACQSLLV